MVTKTDPNEIEMQRPEVNSNQEEPKAFGRPDVAVGPPPPAYGAPITMPQVERLSLRDQPVEQAVLDLTVPAVTNAMSNHNGFSTHSQRSEHQSRQELKQVADSRAVRSPMETAGCAEPPCQLTPAELRMPQPQAASYYRVPTAPPPHDRAHPPQQPAGAVGHQPPQQPDFSHHRNGAFHIVQREQEERYIRQGELFNRAMLHEMEVQSELNGTNGAPDVNRVARRRRSDQGRLNPYQPIDPEASYLPSRQLPEWRRARLGTNVYNRTVVNAIYQCEQMLRRWEMLGIRPPQQMAIPDMPIADVPFPYHLFPQQQMGAATDYEPGNHIPQQNGTVPKMEPHSSNDQSKLLSMLQQPTPVVQPSMSPMQDNASGPELGPVAGPSGRPVRPFKAYPRDPLSFSMNPAAAVEGVLPDDTPQAYEAYRRRMLAQLQGNSHRNGAGSSRRDVNNNVCDPNNNGPALPPRANGNDSDTNSDSSPDNVPQPSMDLDPETAAYRERRRRNNEAAKRSRDARRAKEDDMAIRLAFLEYLLLKYRTALRQANEETKQLQKQLDFERSQRQ